MESKTWEARSLASSQSNTKDVLASSSGPLFLCFVSPLQNLGNVNKIKNNSSEIKALKWLFSCHVSGLCNHGYRCVPPWRLKGRKWDCNRNYNYLWGVNREFKGRKWCKQHHCFKRKRLAIPYLITKNTTCQLRPCSAPQNHVSSALHYFLCFQWHRLCYHCPLTFPWHTPT